MRAFLRGYGDGRVLDFPMTDQTATIDVIEVLDGDTTPDGDAGHLRVRTKDGIVRLNFPRGVLAELPYIVMPLSSAAEAKAMGPGVAHTYVIDRLDVLEDKTLVDTLLLRIFLESGQPGAHVVFEAPSEIVDQLADGIAALRQLGRYAGSSKSSH